MGLKKRPGKYGLYDPSLEKDSCGVGFVANIKGRKSFDIVSNAREILINMTHRGACGCEVNTGDGAGMLSATPWDFLRKVAEKDAGIKIPEDGLFAAGLIFLSQDDKERELCKKKFEKIVSDQGQEVLGWRHVPVDNSMIGPTAKSSEPIIEQVFINAKDGLSPEKFETQLYIIKKYATNNVRGSECDKDHFFYITSLSSRVIVYKGMLTPEQLFDYFLDLKNPDFKTHVAMVHSRFSTNTFPSWDRAQPLRFMSHNGEINTLRGNVNKIMAREGNLRSEVFGDDIEKIFPVIEPDLSDSGSFDNVLELLLMAGRSLPEAVMMMIPEAWQNKKISQHKRDFYEYNSCIMEPWDGPASVAFTDGHVMGAVLDRNGLRPSRYYVTDDDMVIMASEVGVLQVDPERVIKKGRLQPGKMFLVDFEEGRIIDDSEIKKKIASQKPYGEWLKEQKISLSDLKHGELPEEMPRDEFVKKLKTFGYTLEHIDEILKPMVDNLKEPLGSMGNDTPLACLSGKSRLPYDYFKQLFAQVTNPPIDSIREEVVMSLETFIGPEQNLLEVSPEHCHRLNVQMPVLTNRELSSIKIMDHRGWKSKVIDITYPVSEGEKGLVDCINKISLEAEQAIKDGFSIAILSDRAVSKDRVAVSALLAVGSVHHYLIKKHDRAQIGLVLETGEAKEVHHFCMLTGYGADAINPYLAFEVLWHSNKEGRLAGNISDNDVINHYKKAIAKGMRKVFGKMGISTLDSYKGAQIFEAVGLNSTVIGKCFVGTASRIEGCGFDVLAQEALARHGKAYTDGNVPIGSEEIEHAGDYQWRAKGEKHMWDPESVANLQIACKQNNKSFYKQFSDRQNNRSKEQATLRGLLKFKKANSIPLEEVESVKDITCRFASGAMSFGSISIEAHETLAIAMNRLGAKSNTGEGGEIVERFKPLANGDSKRSAIKQVASGRFGVTINYLSNSDEIQIKMAQGAKPGEGGELPGHKVFDIIAKTRYSTPGVGLISPPPHHDIYSIEDLAQLIYDLKNSNPKARISVKLVSEVGVGTIASGVAKGKADHILVSGHDGGTGASAMTGIKNAGLPWELGIAETHQTLVMNDLRSRVVLQTDGQIKTGRDVAIAALLGAEECGFATSALITMGCTMMRKCQKNTCPVGIATQNPELRKRFSGRPEDVVNYLTFVAEELREIMAELGFRTYNEMVGRVDMLDVDEAAKSFKAQGIDLKALLTPAKRNHDDVGVYCTQKQDHEIDKVLDRKLIELAGDTVKNGGKKELEFKIINTDRSFGTMFSNFISNHKGEEGLPNDSIKIKLNGSGGQSLGAWLANGVTMELEGDANDYVGKGLSGGKIVVYPPKNAKYVPEENILIGNVALYGAVKGEAYFRGIAAERFCVRNSGARVVVEGVGDHGCEYMTGGQTIILGETGINFAAGMSGGIAYIWDKKGDFHRKFNPEMVELEKMEESEDIESVKEMITNHMNYTGSTVAKHILDTWSDRQAEFVKVMPTDYKRVLLEKKNAKKEAV